MSYFHTSVKFRQWRHRRNLESRLYKKHKQLEKDRVRFLESLPPTASNDALCEMSTTELRRELQAGRVTSLEVLQAFQRRAAKLLPRNCIAEVFLDAQKVASGCTAINPALPLCGIPVSLKEQIQIIGYDCPLGLVKKVLYPATVDAVVVKMLKIGQAIPFISSSMSPAGLSLNSSNEIYGKQRHLLDDARLSGGSSGGEAMLIAAGASPLGFATDLGGSSRIPSSFCGICCLKPTSRRVSLYGVFTRYKRAVLHIDSTVSLLSRKVDSLVDGMRCLCQPLQNELDPYTVPIPFDEAKFADNTRLVIGYYVELSESGIPAPVPAVQRALAEVRYLLEKAGHTLVPFQPPNPRYGEELFTACVYADGGYQYCGALHDEPINEHLQTITSFLKIPAFLRRFLSLLIRSTSHNFAQYAINTCGRQRGADMLRLNCDVASYVKKVAQAMVTAQPRPIDLILCPATAFPAPSDSVSSILLESCQSYCGLWNLTDFPAGVVPVSHVTESDEAEELRTTSGSYVSRKLHEMQKATMGLPLAVQLVGRPMHEETVLRVMKEIERGVELRRNGGNGSRLA
ncbi:unnamed protein product [Mesocestoides corti]|uniref:Amidase domain-containing protein n=1 Tax=Mesocestoides corti TaxID=53468 RepID=A0A0R3UPV7_MESCO|nr:unnamed protein product [Mesocestoides corti]